MLLRCRQRRRDDHSHRKWTDWLRAVHGQPDLARKAVSRAGDGRRIQEHFRCDDAGLQGLCGALQVNAIL